MNVANIDNLGHVHPDTMWWDIQLGNVRERPFSQIWPDVSHPLMAGLNNARARYTAVAARVRIWPSAMATPACAPGR